MQQLRREAGHEVAPTASGRLLNLAPALTLAFLLGYPLYTTLGAGVPALPVYPGCLLRLAAGCPCPYCGYTRAMESLFAGDLERSLLFQPFALVIVAYVVYLAWRARGARRRGEVLGLSGREFAAFCAITGLAWIAKFALGPTWY